MATPQSTADLLRRSVRTIKDLRKRLDEKNGHGSEPIAIVGMACRLPGGVDDPESFWDLLIDGRDAVTEVPTARWDVDTFYSPPPGKPGRSYIVESNFLTRDVAEFDARFFSISPVEANSMDPQQRLLLETCWEALENAGQNPDRLRGSLAGVYLGISSNGEYSKLVSTHDVNDQYLGTGNNSSIASGRIAYVLGLRGPALSVDTACSSSLVCTHMAIEALRRGECDMALAAGVNLMLAPQVMAGLCAMNALAPDGRSKPFDASADGYGRGEGCGVVVLKRLSDARRDGDTIHAVLRGGAVNNDGDSSGLTVPNGMAQKAVLGRALEECGLGPGDVEYLEAHGTGTLLGDPIEVDAIRHVYCKELRERPLLIGAVKGNIGHLESAAGVASLIKAVLCLQHAEIPAIAGLQELNPRIPGDDSALAFPTAPRSWPDHDGPRRVAVSSFGFSGTNAHLIVEEAPPAEMASEVDSVPRVLQITAKSEAALVRQIARVRHRLATYPDRLADVCYTMDTCRPTFEHRMVAVGSDAAQMSTILDDVLAHQRRNGSLYSNEQRIPGSSHGRDRYAAKRALFTTTPAGAHVAHVDAQIAPKLAFTIMDGDDRTVEAARTLYRLHAGYARAYDELASRLPGPVGAAMDLDASLPSGRVATAVQFCIAQAMLLVLRRYGVAPELILGCGAGRLGAAVASGAVPLNAALEAMARWMDTGTSADLRDLVCPLDTDRPAHRYQSPDLDTATADAAAIKRDLAGLENCRGFDDHTLGLLHDQGYRFYLEVNGDHLGDVFTASAAADVVRLAPLAVQSDSMASTLARLSVLGATLKWDDHYAGQKRTKLALPTYPFEPAHHWLEEPASSIDTNTSALSGKGLDPLPYDLPLPGRHRLYCLDHQGLADLTDNSGVLHVGHFTEMLSDAVAEWFGVTEYHVEAMQFLTPLQVLPNESRDVALLLEEGPADAQTFSFHARLAGGDRWNRHVEGSLRLTVPDGHELEDSPDRSAGQGFSPIGRAAFYDRLARQGFAFGPRVRWVEECRPTLRGGTVRLEPDVGVGFDRMHSLGVHPGMLDSCAQALNFLVLDTAESAGSEGATGNGSRYMVDRLRDVTIRTTPSHESGKAVAEVANLVLDDTGLSGTVALHTAAGAAVLRVGEVHLAAFSEERIHAMRELLTKSTQQGDGLDVAFQTRLTAATEDERVRVMTDYVIALLADTLKMDRAEIAPGDEIRGLGLDSMTGVLLMDRFARRLGVSLTMAELVHCDTVEALSETVCTLTLGGRITPTELQPMDANMDVEHWVRRSTAHPAEARVRLFCFPNGYRSADMFDEWREALAPDIDVTAVKLPGLDAERMAEDAPVHVDDCVQRIHEAVSPDLLRIPCATFGHSWGSLFSFRLAKALESDPNVTLLRTFVAGYTPPNRRNALLDRLYSQLGEGTTRIPTFAEVRDNPGATDAVVKAYMRAWGYSEQDTRVTLPLLLAACCVIDRYRYDPTARLDTPVTAFHGVDDYDVALEEMESWSDLTSTSFRLYTMAGDHQFINAEQSQDQVLARIRSDLSAVVDIDS